MILFVNGIFSGPPDERRKLNWPGPCKCLLLAAAFLWMPLAAEALAQLSPGEAEPREYQINQPGQRPAVVKTAPPAGPARPPSAISPARPEAAASSRVESGADETLVLSKTIEVREYAGISFAADQYQVRAGDTLYRILGRQGLIEAGRVRPETLAAVKAINPGLKDLNRLSPGQILILPSEPLDLNQASKNEAPSSPKAGATIKPVAYYQVAQAGQQPARVTVMEGGPSSSAGQTAQPGRAEERERPISPSAAASSPGPGAAGQTSDGVKYRTITIKTGDTLERILRREGLSTDLIYRHMLKITVDLNDNLKNPNLIVAGMELKVPVQGEYLAQYETAPASGKPPRAEPAVTRVARAPESRPGRAAEGGRAKAGPAAKAPAKAKSAAKSAKKAGASSPVLPSARSEAAKTALTMIFARLGEHVNSNSQLFLPLGDGGQLDINTANFPVLELNNGRRIILDLDDRLPKAMVETLGRNYDYYTVLKAGKNESLSQTLDKLWAACQYFRVYKKGQPFVGGQGVVLRLEADWLIWPTSEAWSKGQPTVINVINEAQKTTPELWLNFLAQNGIKVIDIHAKGNLVGRQAEASAPLEGQPAERKIEVVEVSDTKPAALAGNLLEALGQEYESGVPLDLELPNSKGAGFSLRVAAPIVITQNNQKTILDFGEMPHDISRALKERGYKVVVVSSDPAQVIQAVCDIKGIKLESGLIIKNDANAGPAISLTVKGHSFKYEGREFLATNVDIPPVVAPLISETPVVVIKYPSAQG